MSTLFLVFGLIFPRLTLTFASLTGHTPPNDVSLPITVFDFIFLPRVLIAEYAYQNNAHMAWPIAYYFVEAVMLCLWFFISRHFDFSINVTRCQM